MKKQIRTGVLVLMALLFVCAVMYGISTAALSGSVTALSVSPDPIKLGTSSTIFYTLNKPGAVTMNVYNSNGDLVRNLMNNVTKTASSWTQLWDGRDNSGFQVPDGSYKIMIDQTDATGNIGSGDITKTAAVVPAITAFSDSPDPFNPTVGEKVYINYTLSSNALVTVTILNGYTPVKTICTNVSNNSGSYTVEWDGKDSTGKLAADAGFTYQIDAASPLVPAFKSTAKGTVVVEKEPPQITGFTANPSPLKLGVNNLSISYTLSEAAKVTLKVCDSAGNVVKTLQDALAKPVGFVSASWDGTGSTGALVPEGTYRVVLNAVDNFNKSSGDKTINVTAGYVPAINNPAVNPASFNPNAGTITISYDLPQKAVVNIQILSGYTPVKTLTNNVTLNAGAQSVVWDGKDSSAIPKVVGDGTYTFKITATSPTVSTFFSTYSGTVTVDKGALTISSLTASPSPLKLGVNNLNISYTLSDAANVFAEVYNGTTLVKTLASGAAKNAGYVSHNWDGTNTSGALAAEGTYTVKVSAVGLSRTTTASVDAAAGYLPTVTGLSSAPEPYDPGTGPATINFTTSNLAKVKLIITQGYSAVKTIDLGNLAAGTNSTTWDGKDSSATPKVVSDGSYTYKIEATSPTVSAFTGSATGTLTVTGANPKVTSLSVSPVTVKIGSPATIRYSVSEPATIKTQVLDALGAVVVNLPDENKSAGGSYSITWDTSASALVPGSYTLRITATDAENLSGSAELAFQAGKVPVISGVAANPPSIDISKGETSTTISYSVDTDSYVTVKALDSVGKVWKTLFLNKRVNGSDSVVLVVYENGQAMTGTLGVTVDASSVIGYFRAQQAAGSVQVGGNGSGQINCTDCHQTYPNTHPMTNCFGCHGNDEPIGNCAACHAGVTHSDSLVLNKFQCVFCHNSSFSSKVPGHGDITALHDTTLQADCQKCHNQNLSVEHPLRQDVNGVPYNCNTCHSATATQTVKDAVYNKQKDCAACHTTALHSTVHINTAYTALPKDPAMDCTMCHNNDIGAEHLARTDALGVNYNCNTCHGSTVPATVQNAVYNRNKNCEACHIDSVTGQPTVHTSSGSPLHDSAYVTGPDVNCQQCHANNIKVEHVGRISTTTNQAIDCATCHSSTNTAVKAAITAKDNKCSACHTYPNTKHQPIHTTTIYTTDSARTDAGTCVTCHTTKALTTLHVGVVNTTTQQAMTCDACHASQDPKVVSAITTKLTNSCEACHTVHLPKDATTVHNTTDVFAATMETDCATCHDRNVKIEHLEKNRVVNGAAMTCDSCHGSTARQQVKDAIAANNLRCDACHTMPPVKHAPAHTAAVYTGDAARTDKTTCSLCHVSALTTEHVARLNTHTNQAMDCKTCHSSTAAAAVKTAITTKNGNCEACHTTHAVKSAITEHAGTGVYVTNADVTCTGCHNRNIRTEHMDNTARTTAAGQPITCDTCHGSASAAVQTAITAKDNKCSACHTYPNTKHNPVHTTTIYTTDSARTDAGTCATCHTTKALTTLHVGVVNTTTQQAMTCDTCHASQDPKVVSAITGKLTNSCEACHIVHTPKDAATVHNTTDVFAAVTDTDCSTCHSRNVKTEHLDKNRVVNGAAMTCDSCHGSTARQQVKDAIAANNLRCDACHTNTDHTHVVTTYEATSDTNCVNCHSTGTDPADAAVKTTELIALHSKYGITCAACHTDPFLGSVITGDGNIDMMRNGQPIYCADCHNGTLAPAASHKADHKATGDMAVTCSSCHDGVTAKGTFNTNNQEVDISSSAIHPSCSTCHSSANQVVKDFIAANAGQVTPAYQCNVCHNSITPKHNKQHSVASFLNNSADTSCTSCHDADVSVLHSVATKATLNCDTCHGANPALAGTKPTIAANLSSVTTTPNFTCQSCHTNAGSHIHNVPANGYEQTGSESCSSCHATDPVTGTGELVAVHQSGLGTAFSCSTCHNARFEGTLISGDGNIDMLQNGTTPIYCSSCHNGTLAPLRDTGHQAEHTAQHNASNMDCASCHGFTLPAATAADITSLTIHKNGCNTCHGSAVRDDVKLVIAAKKGQTNPVYDCEECHGGAIHLGWESKHQPVFPVNQPAGDCANCHSSYLTTEHEKALVAPVNTEIGYKVFRSPDGVINWSEIGSTTAAGFADSGLTAGTTYFYKVQAYDGKPNYSGFSNVISVLTKAGTPVSTTVNPALARYATGNNGDSAADPASTTDVLASLTDTSNSTYSSVLESGTSDRYIFVQLSNDANNYSKVELRLTARYVSSTNLIVYPYQSNATSITSSVNAKGISRSSSTSYITETIDVTQAAQAMSGYGWMKFRIKPDPARTGTVYISKVELILSQNPVSGGTATNPPGTLTPSSNDNSAPTVPGGLAGTANYYDRVDLTWTASTDTGGVGSTCAVCHSAATRQQAKDAVAAKNANCSACHTIHADIDAAHTGPALATTPSNCSGCHSNVLSIEHSVNAKLTQNSSMNCDTCHKSTLAKVKSAIASSVTDKRNLTCATCHTGTADGVHAVHGNVAAPHLSGIFPTATDADCLKCHTVQAADFVSTKAGYHVANGLASKASGQGTYVSPWTSTSAVGCKGCHGNDNDGKAQAANILKRPYTYTSNSNTANMLCYLCHDRNTYGGSGGQSGFSSGSTNLHNIGDHKMNNVSQCSWCHGSVPHATNKAHLIVIKTDPNSAGNTLNSFTHPASGQYQVSSCTSSTNGCTEH